MGVLDINYGTKFEFSIKEIINKDSSFPNIRIYIGISNSYINHSYENEYYEKEIEESNLPCEASKLKRLIPIEKDNIIEDDQVNYKLISIDNEEALMIYNLIAQYEEKYNDDRYFNNYISNMEVG